MHEQARKHLYGNIVQYLSACSISNGRLALDGDSNALNRIVQFEEKHLHEWMPRYSLVVEIVSRAQNRVTEAGPAYIGAFVELLGNDGVAQVASEATDFVADLPYEYVYWAQLRGIIGIELDDPIPVGDLLILRRADDIPEPPDAKKELLAAALLGDSAPPLRPQDTVLQIRTHGYSSNKATDSAPESALSITKEFLALSEALGVLEARNEIPDQSTTSLLVQLPHGNRNHPNWVTDIPIQVGKRVDSYRLGGQVTHRPAGLLGTLPGQTAKFIAGHMTLELTGAELRAAVAEKMKTIGCVFFPDPDKHATAIRTAAQWYFDAMAADNETNAFIFTSLGFEALFGDGKQTDGPGTMRLLANRLAYSMIGDRNTREKRISEFEKFYAIRSSIVHGREPRLSYSARKVLLWGKHWLKEALSSELHCV